MNQRQRLLNVHYYLDGSDSHLAMFEAALKLLTDDQLVRLEQIFVDEHWGRDIFEAAQEAYGI